ncbi:MAG: MarR family transcriptional regulator [Methanoregulaceae archaeon]|jgi:DNA-binding MarR family transcriptional regulator|nr:MarR family transcriptional regulator [Methanoregulaceae archaeon]
MKEREEHLFEVFENLLKARHECSCTIFSECGLPDMTVRQIAYLKTIDEQGEITFSQLAGITRNSKPTISEMINKFERMACVYRERCPEDGRVLYIRLTDKGQKIAKAEQAALRMVIDRMMESLDETEQELLLKILEKVR